MMQNVAWKAKNTSCGIGGPLARREGDVREEGVVEAADEGARPVERERVADHRPRDGRDRDRGDAHHEGVERVLGPHQPGVEEPERRRHHQDEGGGGEHPGGVAGVDRLPRQRRASAPPASRRPRRSRRSGCARPARSGEHEDLAVAHLARPAALAQRVDRRLDERLATRRSRSAPSPRAPSSRWCRGTSRPGPARRRAPARGSASTPGSRRGRAPRARRSPAPGARSR